MKNPFLFILLFLSHFFYQNNLISQVNPACTWTFQWQLDCSPPSSLNVGMECLPSGTRICQQLWGSYTCEGCWTDTCTTWTYASPPFCYNNTGYSGPAGCTSRGRLLLCIDGVAYADGELFCCNSINQTDPYPYCISCGCGIVKVNEAGEVSGVYDPRPYGDYCPPNQ